MTADDPRLAKIRALLAKAEATNFPEEAQAFTAKAQELMVKWAIDDAMLADARPGHATHPTSVIIRVGNPPYQGPKQVLLSVIARNLDCRIVLEAINQRGAYDNDAGKYVYFKRAKRFTQAYVIGFPRDLEFVQNAVHVVPAAGRRRVSVRRGSEAPIRRDVAPRPPGEVAQRFHDGIRRRHRPPAVPKP